MKRTRKPLKKQSFEDIFKDLLSSKAGRRNARQQIVHEYQLKQFCNQIIEINSRLNFKVSARGWCYILEEYGLDKGSFDKAQNIIKEARKTGYLPLNITAEDENRQTINAEEGMRYHPETPREYLEQEAEEILFEIQRLGAGYRPKPFWQDQNYYVEMMVEKIDLRSLFKNTCEKYYVPLTNIRGWADVHSRANMMKRFAQHEDEGRQCILLYCGDHDPGGLHISEQLKDNLAELSGAVGWSPDNLIIDRFGLNYNFILDNNLTWVENLETSSGGRLNNPEHKDHRKPYVQDYIKRFGVRKVEANALVTRPKAGRNLCLEAIEKYISPESIQEYKDDIAEARKDIKQYVPDIVRELPKRMFDDGDDDDA